jgi:hypothetical protein
LTRSTRSLPCTLALVNVLDVSHCSWSPSLLVPRSKPRVRPSPLPVHRHDTSLLDLHLAVDHRLRAPHLHNTSQVTCRTHSFRYGKVGHHSTYFVDHIDNHSSQNEHTEILVNLMFALTIWSSVKFLILRLLSILVVPVTRLTLAEADPNFQLALSPWMRCYAGFLEFL